MAFLIFSLSFQPGEKQLQSVDAKPSDAINLAVRCKVSYKHNLCQACDDCPNRARSTFPLTIHIVAS